MNNKLRVAIDRLLKWVEPIAGDNRDEVARLNEEKTFEAVKAALLEPEVVFIVQKVKTRPERDPILEIVGVYDDFETAERSLEAHTDTLKKYHGVREDNQMRVWNFANFKITECPVLHTTPNPERISVLKARRDELNAELFEINKALIYTP